MASKQGRMVCRALLVLLGGGLHAAAQTPPEEASLQALVRQVEQLSTAMAELREELSQSRLETREVRAELQRLLARLPADAGPVDPGADPASGSPGDAAERLARLEEDQALLGARVEEQNQTKVESASRYRTRLSGIVLLNAFAGRGHTDSREIPNLARPAGGPGGDFGLTALQSELGFEAYGPTLAGARTSAGLRFNFFALPAGDADDDAGAVRLRAAAVRLDWPRTSVVVAQDIPFFSPLSPSSIASFAYPGFSYAGNLWGWTPQARVEHRLDLDEANAISLQAGVIRPASRPSRQPGFAARLAWSRPTRDDAFTLGVGGYYGRQNYSEERSVDGWAGTVDWNVPLGARLALSGEFYRGRALGGFGAAQGRSVLRTAPETDAPQPLVGMNATGGWTQLKIKATPTVEFHAAYGADHPFRRDVRRFYSSSAYADVAANRSGMANVMYRPRTNLLFSLEYRRLKTERLDGGSDTADHLNLGVGVLF